MNEEDIKDSLQVYEVGFHILPTVDESSVEGEVSGIKDLISKNGGTIISESFPTLMNLAYSITKTIGTSNKDFDKAYFGSIKFELAKDKIESVNGGLKTTPNVLRFILVKTVKENTLYYAKEHRSNKDKDASDVEVDIPTEVTSDAEIDKSIEDLIVA